MEDLTPFIMNEEPFKVEVPQEVEFKFWPGKKKELNQEFLPGCESVDDTPGTRFFLLKQFSSKTARSEVLEWAEEKCYRQATLKEFAVLSRILPATFSNTVLAYGSFLYLSWRVYRHCARLDRGRGGRWHITLVRCQNNKRTAKTRYLLVKI